MESPRHRARNEDDSQGQRPRGRQETQPGQLVGAADRAQPRTAVQQNARYGQQNRHRRVRDHHQQSIGLPPLIGRHQHPGPRGPARPEHRRGHPQQHEQGRQPPHRRPQRLDGRHVPVDQVARGDDHCRGEHHDVPGERDRRQHDRPGQQRGIGRPDELEPLVDQRRRTAGRHHQGQQGQRGERHVHQHAGQREPHQAPSGVQMAPEQHAVCTQPLDVLHGDHGPQGDRAFRGFASHSPEMVWLQPALAMGDVVLDRGGGALEVR